MQTNTLTSYMCEFCGWESLSREAILLHEPVCILNPANLDKVKALAGRMYTDGEGTYIKVLSANPGAIRCVVLKEKFRERHYVVQFRTYERPDEITGWTRPIKEGEDPRETADRMTGLVKIFLEGE